MSAARAAEVALPSRRLTSETPLPVLLGAQSTADARAELLAWYDVNQRQLPWRSLRDPWATWVSEVMLQQTRVSSVLAYFDRFMTRFPTPSALASAEWDEVASLWAGLGYYRRAKNLWQGARDVVERHGGEIPSDPAEVRALTGVGPYTAGAILSIAFQQEAPLVDGNVMRVFARLYRIEAEAQSREAQRAFWGLAAEWVRGERPGDLNQAIMELGATVCHPKRPTCLLCPLRAACRATHESDPQLLPVKKRRERKIPVEDHLALLISPLQRPQERGEERDFSTYLVQRRDGDGLLGGLWGLPHALRTASGQATHDEIKELSEVWLNDTSDDAKRSIATALAPLVDSKSNTSELRVALLLPNSLSELTQVEVKHRFTHKEWRWRVASLHLIICASGEDPTERYQRLTGEEATLLSEIRLEQSERSIDDQRALNEGVVSLATLDELNSLALGGPSLKALRSSGVPLKARRGSGRS